jgi:hypothetical protein
VKRMIRVLAVAVLVAMILVSSMSPAMARRQAGGIQMPTTKPCDNKVPHFEFRNTPPHPCWKVLPDHDG